MMQIQSHSHPYTVSESNSVAEAVRLLSGPDMPFFLVDQKVAGLYEHQLSTIPAKRIYRIEATEEAKSYEQLTPVFCWLLDSHCRRNSHLVVIGGGVLQDIGCFIASVLSRGIRWTLLPTTLLAQCDSCIGSKSSLNINRFKNQLGTFYPPHEVRLVFEFLKTLTQEEIFSGLGEAIKLHLIDGETSIARLQKKLTTTRLQELPLGEIVWDSLRIKKRFIEEDEFDRGVRNLLNYGHTFAHAYESASRYVIPHGIAVTLGVASATILSEKQGLLPMGYYRQMEKWLRPYFAGHETTVRNLDPKAVVEAMRFDKKNIGDEITFILTRGAGQMEKVKLSINNAPGLLSSVWDTLCEEKK